MGKRAIHAGCLMILTIFGDVLYTINKNHGKLLIKFLKKYKNTLDIPIKV